MRIRKRTVWRLALALLLLLLAAGIAAPYIHADRFASQIRASLQQALNRRVEIGRVHLDLFNGPGFSISDVIIHDDPRLSAEPLAYVTALETRLSLKSLWTGQLDFSTLRLVDPSVNLEKSPDGSWNCDVLSRTVGAAQAGRALPQIRVRGGRLNFRSGAVKSVFYVTDADLDIDPPRGADAAWRVRFSGEPARSDRAAHGFGRLSGHGEWRAGGRLDLQLDLEESALGELVSLIQGHDLGVHGDVTAQARLAGSIPKLEVTGRAQIRGIHRWDLGPPHPGQWNFAYRGSLDLAAERLELESLPPEGSPAYVALRFRAAGYLSRPRWGLHARLQGVPVTQLPELARQFGIVAPEGVHVEGAVDGVIGYSPDSGLQGALAARDVSVRAPDSAPLQCERAQVLVEGNRLRLAPSVLAAFEDERATLDGDYDRWTRELRVRLASRAMSIGVTRQQRLPGTDEIPLLQHCRGGAWQGAAQYRWEGEGPGEWSGDIELRNTEVGVPGMAVPVEVLSARVVLKSGSAVMQAIRARAGKTEFAGQYRYDERAARPHHFRLAAAEVDALELERVLAPALDRRVGLLARAIRLGRVPVPEWMAERRAEGTVQIGSLLAGGVHLASKLRARVIWDGPTVDLTELEAHAEAAAFSGRLAVNLRRATPVYRLAGSVRSLAWSGGKWEAEGVAETSGVGADLLLNLQTKGAFSGHAVAFSEEAGFDKISGRFGLRFTRGLPRISLTELHAVSGPDVFTGEGRTLEDGRLSIEFTNGRKQMRLAGTLSPFQLEAAVISR